MHVLLRDSSSRLFYAGRARWTSDTDLACDFGSITEAEEFGQSQNVPDLEIVLRYESPLCELTLPMPEVASRPSAYGS